MSLIKQFPKFRKKNKLMFIAVQDQTVLHSCAQEFLDYLILKTKAPSILLNVENYSPNDRAPHAKRLDSIRLYLIHRKTESFLSIGHTKKQFRHYSVTCTPDAGF